MKLFYYGPDYNCKDKFTRIEVKVSWYWLQAVHLGKKRTRNERKTSTRDEQSRQRGIISILMSRLITTAYVSFELMPSSSIHFVFSSFFFLIQSCTYIVSFNSHLTVLMYIVCLLILRFRCLTCRLFRAFFQTMRHPIANSKDYTFPDSRPISKRVNYEDTGFLTTFNKSYNTYLAKIFK